MRRTPLYQTHLDAGARMVEFAGWEMPINYGSQIDEHHAVRMDSGVFDVSHMCPVDIHGDQARPYLEKLLANDVGKLHRPGRALYSCMLQDDGGVIDDLICYYLSDDHYRIVVNAGTADKDVAWMKAQARPFGVEVRPLEDYGMIAVQGPDARQKVFDFLHPDHREAAAALEPFFAASIGDFFKARTGYTGEDGFEIITTADAVVPLWEAMVASGVKPCGLGARDSLRLEAGMRLYGQDMDESVTPLESGLEWTVAWDGDREFNGRKALEAQKEQGVNCRFAGVVLLDRGVLRHGQPVRTASGQGVLTSGGFSPTLKHAIGLARLPSGAENDCEVEIRGKWLKAAILHPPFVRSGKPSARMQALLDAESGS